MKDIVKVIYDFIWPDSVGKIIFQSLMYLFVLFMAVSAIPQRGYYLLVMALCIIFNFILMSIKCMKARSEASDNDK